MSLEPPLNSEPKVIKPPPINTGFTFSNTTRALGKYPLESLGGAFLLGMASGYFLLGNDFSTSQRPSGESSSSETERKRSSDWKKEVTLWLGEEVNRTKSAAIHLFLNTAKDAAFQIFPQWEAPVTEAYEYLKGRIESDSVKSAT